MPGFDFKLTKFFNRLRKPLISYERLMEDSQAPGLLKEGHWVAMLYLDVTGFELAEQINSSLSYKQVSQTLTHLARLHTPGCLKNYHIFEQRRWGDDLVIYFYAPNQSPPSAMELSELADSVRVDLGARLNKKYSHLIPTTLGFHIGYALLNPHAGSIEKILYTAFKEAVMVSKGHLNAYELQRQQEYKELLQDKNVNTVYQPIVGLVTGGIMGYEALSRGPADTFFANPENLFSYAEKTNQLFVLEKLAREKAMFHFGENILKHKLFININPMVVHDRSFIADDIKAALSELGASPDQVVFEITERTNIENFNAFRKSLQYYRQHGFLVAIDDAGSGYSSLQAILELQPDFIKIDLSLIRDIDKIRNKQVLVETFVAFSEKTGSQIIAEGIENQNELSCLQELGVPLGQGFFFGPSRLSATCFVCSGRQAVKGIYRGIQSPGAPGQNGPGRLHQPGGGYFYILCFNQGNTGFFYPVSPGGRNRYFRTPKTCWFGDAGQAVQSIGKSVWFCHLCRKTYFFGDGSQSPAD